MFKKESKVDILSIGDITTDLFIRLEDAHVHCRIDSDACELCLRFGDKVPFEEATEVSAVGNSPNAAVSAARLGLKSALVTNIGDDETGKKCLDSLKRDGVNTKYVKEEKNKKTNYHYVLWHEIDRTILIKHTQFEYSLPKLPESKWIYLSSLAENSLPYHLEIAEYLKDHPETMLAFQPGTFQIKIGAEKLKDIYAKTKVFFCNIEEAEKILGVSDKDVLKLAEGIKKLGPEIVVLSDGPKGAFLYLDGELWHTPMYPDIAPPLDRTGAGDAFSSTFIAALALGKSPLEALSWGPVNSMSVVQKIGAQEGLLTEEKLLEYLKVAPADYKINKV